MRRTNCSRWVSPGFLKRVAVRFRLPPRTEYNFEAGFGGIKWDKWDSAAQVAALRHATLERVAGYRPCRDPLARCTAWRDPGADGGRGASHHGPWRQPNFACDCCDAATALHCASRPGCIRGFGSIGWCVRFCAIHRLGAQAKRDTGTNNKKTSRVFAACRRTIGREGGDHDADAVHQHHDLRWLQQEVVPGRGSGPGQPHQEGGQGQKADRTERRGGGRRRRGDAHARPHQRSLPHRLFRGGDEPLLARRHAARGEHAHHHAPCPHPVRPRLHRPGLRRDGQGPHGHRDPQRDQPPAGSRARACSQPRRS